MKKSDNKIGVSVIIPCYKRIDQTIRSIKKVLDSDGWNNDYNAELIIADSTEDDSLKKVLFEKFKEKFENKEFLYLHPSKRGISINKNTGAKKAKYPLLVYCDSDMEVEKNVIFDSIKRLEKDFRIAALTSTVIWKKGKKDGQLDRPKEEDRFINYKGTKFIEYIYSRYTITYKKVLLELGGYDEKVFNMRGEGSDLSTRYWRAGYPLAYDSSLKVYHRHDAPDSIALRIDHPEWSVAKDIFLLAYKFNNFEDDGLYFPKNLNKIFGKFDSMSHYRLIQGLAKHFNFIVKSKKEIDKQKKEMKPQYDFKFQEIFSNKKMLLKCIDEAQKKMKPIHKEVFKK
jgi:glycosyltransferase involved in cell wall biosynthesis